MSFPVQPTPSPGVTPDTAPPPPRRRARRPASRLALSGGAAVLVTAVAAGGAAGASPAHPADRAAAAAARSAHRPLGRTVSPTTSWQKLTSSGLSPDDQPSLLRRDGVLYVAWQSTDSGTSESVRVGRISGKGQLLGNATAVSHWAVLAADPALLGDPGSLHVVFGGIRTTNPDEPFSGQLAASVWINPPLLPVEPSREGSADKNAAAAMK